MTTNQSNTHKRGFASMDEQQRREIARRGGLAANRRGHTHQFTPEEASEAGKKGGAAISQDREHMSRIGRKGGQNAQARRAQRQERGPDTP